MCFAIVFTKCTTKKMNSSVLWTSMEINFYSKVGAEFTFAMTKNFLRNDCWYCTMDIQHILHFPTMFKNHRGCSKSHPFHRWNIVATFIDENNLQLNSHHQQFMCLCLSYNHKLTIKKYWTKRPCTWNKRTPKIEWIKLST